MSESIKQKKGQVVVIDDDEAARSSIKQMLQLRGYSVESFSSGEAALAWPGLADVKCIICDVKMPGMNGEEFLSEVVQHHMQPPVVMITGHGDVSMAVRCLKSGAYEFVEKPFEDDVLLACVSRAVEKTELRQESDNLRKQLTLLSPHENGCYGMVGRSRLIQDVYEQIEVAAKSDAAVLIIGETGAGKELVARAIHSRSRRVDKPFLPVNSGALPEAMLESELFGHARGSFTGAMADRDGKLVTASGGTLLLDEIESISLRAQVQLLRVLEDGFVEPLGADKPRRVDIRLITTTKTNPGELIQQGLLREDFYHRIMVLSIFVPPLRERSEDIPLLISHFLKIAADNNGIAVPEIPEKTFDEMLQYQWPGNIRELRNAVERILITSHRGVTGAFSPYEQFNSSTLLSLPACQGRLRTEMEEKEKSVIEASLCVNRGEINATYRALGISRRALYERMKKYELNKENFKN